MSEKYFTVNIHAYLDKDAPTYIGEEGLYELLSDFSCPLNPDVEHFLLHNAIEFTKKDQSVTYLVLREDTAELTGYFSLAVKPISVRASAINKTMARKLARVSTLNEEAGVYTTAAYLIAQLGKNFSIPKEERIRGADLLDLALDAVANAKYSVGGVLSFLECEDKEALMNFYAAGKFKFFDIRATNRPGEKEARYLNQLLRFI